MPVSPRLKPPVQFRIAKRIQHTRGTIQVLVRESIARCRPDRVRQKHQVHLCEGLRGTFAVYMRAGARAWLVCPLEIRDGQSQ